MGAQETQKKSLINKHDIQLPKTTLILSVEMVQHILATQGMESLLTPTVMQNAITMLYACGLSNSNMKDFAPDVINRAIMFAVIAAAVEEKNAPVIPVEVASVPTVTTASSDVVICVPEKHSTKYFGHSNFYYSGICIPPQASTEAEASPTFATAAR